MPIFKIFVEGRLFFVGLIVAFFGLLIIVYDYPQMIYIQAMTADELQLFDRTTLDRFERIQIEFYLGIAIFTTGAALLFFSKFTPAILDKK